MYPFRNALLFGTLFFLVLFPAGLCLLFIVFVRLSHSTGPGGSGLTKGTACNKDLRSQKLQSEARPDVSGECLQRSRDIFIIARDFLDTAV